MPKNKLLLYAIIFILVFYTDLSAVSRNSIFIFLDNSICVSCVLSSVTNTLKNLKIKYPESEVALIFKSNDTNEIKRISKLLPKGTQYYTGEKANALFYLYGADLGYPYIVAQDSALNFIRLDNVKNNYINNEKEINKFFGGEGRLKIIDKGSYYFGNAISAQADKNGNIAIINDLDNIFLIDSMKLMRQLNIHREGELKYTYVSKEKCEENEIPDDKIISPIFISNFNEGEVEIVCSILHKILEDSITIEGKVYPSIELIPKYGILKYNYWNKSISIDTLPSEIDQLSWKNYINFKNNFLFFTANLRNEINLDDELENFALVKIPDAKTRRIDSISLFDMNRFSSVNRLIGRIDYVPINRENGLLINLNSGLFMLKRSEKYKELVKSGIFAYLFSSDSPKNLIFNYSQYKFNNVVFSDVQSIKGDYYVFIFAKGRADNKVFISKYDTNGNFKYQQALQIDDKFKKIFTFASNDKLYIIANTVNDEFKLYEIN